LKRCGLSDQADIIAVDSAAERDLEIKKLQDSGVIDTHEQIQFWLNVIQNATDSVPSYFEDTRYTIWPYILTINGKIKKYDGKFFVTLFAGHAESYLDSSNHVKYFCPIPLNKRFLGSSKLIMIAGVFTVQVLEELIKLSDDGYNIHEAIDTIFYSVGENEDVIVYLVDHPIAAYERMKEIVSVNIRRNTDEGVSKSDADIALEYNSKRLLKKRTGGQGGM